MTSIYDINYVVPYVVSNLVGFAMLPLAFYKPRYARILFMLLFAGASCFNLYTAVQNPDAYLMYSETSIPIYQSFINGWFSRHISMVVSIIAIGQALIAIGLLLRGFVVKLSLSGIIIFLLAIAPLGIGSGFPFSLTASLSAYWVIRKDSCTYLWKGR